MPKLAISNIAWSAQNDGTIHPLLKQHGITGIEIAPTKVWPTWEEITLTKACDYREKLTAAGFSIPALQAILFNKPECLLFGNAKQQQAFIDHLAWVADIAQALGAPIIVFGAPQQRSRQHLEMAQAIDIALPILQKIGANCLSKGVCFCIEPNPTQYHCNFITNTQEGIAVVKNINRAGVGLHLDSAAMLLASENITQSLTNALPYLKHFHVSEPQLSGFNHPVSPHTSIAESLNHLEYSQWISLEMRASENEYANVKTAIDYMRRTYATSN